jgi:serine/threonine protein kinase
VSYCPTCQKHFEESGGFCPYDGARLLTNAPAAAPGSSTQAAAPLRAVSARDESSAAALLKSIKEAKDPSAEYDRLIGTTLDGRYYIDGKLGEGGMGVVFAGKHIVIEKKVAIKVLKREVARDHSTVKRFVQEAKAASRIGHPNIVDVTDFGTTPDGMTYSVMEFVDGQTLGEVIKGEAPLSIARVLPIVAQIAKALGAAHEKGIVHRDLKPENVFIVDRDGRPDFVKIVDFGIAKVTPIDGNAEGPRLTRAGTVFGTPEYMAPEQAAGRGDTDKRVDVYALGTIMYEMLVGQVPHKGDSMVRTLAMQMLDPIDPPSRVNPDLDISNELETVIMTSLAKKRENRYQSMGELVRALQLVSGGVPLAQPLQVSSTSKISTSDAKTLVPRPPGASVNAASPSAAHDTVKEQPSFGADPSTGGSAANERTRSKSEPAFVSGRRPVTFDALFDDSLDTEVPATKSRWPLLLAIVVLFAVAGVAIALFVKRGSSGDDDNVAHDSRDAAVVTEHTVDAGTSVDGMNLIVEIPLDAIDDRVPDRDRDGPGRRKKTDAGTTATVPTNGKTVEVQVITRPEGGTVYINQSYRGSSGVTIAGPEGKTVNAVCKLPGYNNGKVKITYDDVTPVVVCIMKRDKKCIDGIKNPFDDCP